MKVLMFIELVSGIKYPKITIVGIFEATVCGCFVVVPFFLLLYSSFLVAIFLIFVLNSFSYFGKKIVSTFSPSYMWIGEQGWSSKLFISSFWLPFKLGIQPCSATPTLSKQYDDLVQDPLSVPTSLRFDLGTAGSTKGLSAWVYEPAVPSGSSSCSTNQHKNLDTVCFSAPALGASHFLSLLKC